MPPVHKRLHIHLDTTRDFVGKYQMEDNPPRRTEEPFWSTSFGSRPKPWPMRRAPWVTEARRSAGMRQGLGSSTPWKIRRTLSSRSLKLNWLSQKVSWESRRTPEPPALGASISESTWG